MLWWTAWKELQPNAVIYLQTLPPVNEGKAAENGLGSYINNTNVNAFNEIIVETAKGKASGTVGRGPRVPQ